MKIATFITLILFAASSASFGQSNDLYSSQYQTPIVSSLSSINQMTSTTQSQSTSKSNNGNSSAGYAKGGPYESNYGSSTNSNNGNGQGQGNPNGYQDVPNGPWNNNNTSNPQHPAHPCNPNNKNFPNDGCRIAAPNVPINDHLGLLMLVGGTVAIWMMYKRKQNINTI